MLVSEGCCCIAYMLLGGQPLAVLRSTGPLLAYVKILYKWTDNYFSDMGFLPFYMYTGIWLGIFLVLYSFSEASVLIKYCGRYTEEILAFMVRACVRESGRARDVAFPRLIVPSTDRRGSR